MGARKENNRHGIWGFEDRPFYFSVVTYSPEPNVELFERVLGSLRVVSAEVEPGCGCRQGPRIGGLPRQVADRVHASTASAPTWAPWASTWREGAAVCVESGVWNVDELGERGSCGDKGPREAYLPIGCAPKR